MSYITSFLDGESYGAEDLNKVVSRIITSGIEDSFIDGVPYNVRRLNNLSKSITTRGVIGSESTALKVMKSGAEYYVSPGTAFFGNGTTLEVIENEPVVMSDLTVTNYVYLVSSEEENRNYIAVSTVEPDIADDNIVMLCEILPGGDITDRRCYATGKLRGMYQDNEFTVKSIRIRDTVTFADGSNDAYITHDLGCSRFAFMFISMWEEANSDGNYACDEAGSLTGMDRSCVALWIPSQNRYIGIGCNDYDGDTGNCYCFDSFGSMDNMYNGDGFVIGGTTSTKITLKLSHVNGNLWQFRYNRKNVYYTPNNIVTDFQLFYI